MAYQLHNFRFLLQAEINAFLMRFVSIFFKQKLSELKIV